MNDSDRGDRFHESSIAVVGMAGRFPGARNVDEFWRNLRDGVESVCFFSDDELLAEGIGSEIVSNRNYVKAKGVLDDFDLFDAPFFGYTRREAELTDPQHRVFLECAWEALENAGYDSQRYDGLIGVYAGVGANTYLLNIYSNPKVIKTAGSFMVGLLNEKDHLTTRVSYKLNLRGPSINVQTACSTSLVAVHLACQSLINGECDMALAGGVGVSVPQKCGYLYREGGILSPDGHCRAFDAEAQGTVGGNGAGILVLKRFTDAQADGDRVIAIILGSAVNNDGAFKVGYTSPSIDGQAQVISEALSIAKVDSSTIGYVEAHGTGTELGDPIEIAALTRAFRSHTAENGFCGLGSVKTNVGHLDAAAGVTGLIKTVLSLEHKQIPPSLHFQQPNPKIDFANSPFYVNSSLREWSKHGAPRRAAVSSFGIGGTNAHVIVEEAPERANSDAQAPVELVVLSARTGAALDSATSNLAGFLEQNRNANLGDVAYTLAVGRRSFECRRFLVSVGVEDAIESLAQGNPQRIVTQKCEAGDRPVAFMFSGQGSQYINMTADLYREVSSFREQVDLCSEIVEPEIGTDLRRLMYPNPSDAAESAEKLNQTFLTQPALFVVEYALAKLWMKWGVKPFALIGHSVGEYVAACLAGVFSVEDALRVVAVRGRLIQGLPKGAMAAVRTSESRLSALLTDGCSIAAVNAPQTCVISGPTDVIDRMRTRLDAKGIQSASLHTSHAFHSAMMEPAVRSFREALENVRMQAPRVAMVSCVTGTWITEEEATSPDYWARHLRQAVRFSDGVQLLLREQKAVLLEVGPGRALSLLAIEHDGLTEQHVVLSSSRHPRDRKNDFEFILDTLGRLWLAGVVVDWEGFYQNARRRRMALPTYPFERQRYWLEIPRGDNRESVNNNGKSDAQSSRPKAGAEATLPPHAFATSGDTNDSAGMERILSRQLRLMSSQLQLLKDENSTELPDGQTSYE